MNKKIFTLFVGALLLLGSVFTASAQINEGGGSVPYRFKGAEINQTDFYDVLRADTVKRLPGDPNGFYFLLSVTGLANPDGSVANQFATIANNSPIPGIAGVNGNKYVFNKASLESSWVMFPDKDGSLRIDQISMVDSAYNFKWGSKSYKIGAIRKTSWCVSVNKYDGVAGSNVTFDFTNVDNGYPLEAPLYDEDNFNDDGNGVYTYKYDFSLSKDAVEKTNIVSGWHFSQSFVSTQDLQYGMPLYSYIAKDTVEVLVLADKDRFTDGMKARNFDGQYYVSSSGDTLINIGGYYVTVAKVCVNDLIRDAQGNVRVAATDGGKEIKNVLLFTLKKIDRFVMNADDWNAGGREFVIGGNKAAFNDANAIKLASDPMTSTKYNNVLDGVSAVEVNDSLYHYGYMQFTKGSLTNTTDRNWLYVDTAFANVGETEYLAFNYGPRRDSTCLDNMTYFNAGSPAAGFDATFESNGMAWGESCVRSVGYEAYRLPNGKPDSAAYVTKGYTDFSRWYKGNSYGFGAALLASSLDGCVKHLVKDSIYYMIGSEDHSALSNYANPGPFGANAFGAPIYDTINFNSPSHLYPLFSSNEGFGSGGGTGIISTDFVDFVGRSNANDTIFFIYDGGEYLRRYAKYLADSINFLYAFHKDSLMENQSKFRVVYDPFADSAWVNVYQSRVRYANLADTKNPTYEPWWTNSFAYTETPVGGHTGFIEPYMIGPTAWGFTNVLKSKNDRTCMSDFSAIYKENQTREFADDKSLLVSPTPLGNTSVSGWHGVNDGLSAANIDAHSFLTKYTKSKWSNMDKVLISTADTCALYERYFIGYGVPGVVGPVRQLNGLSHIYGASKAKGDDMPTYAYKDSLFYIDAQDWDGKKIMTLDQSVDNDKNTQSLNMQIKVTYGDKCKPSDDDKKATINDNLYLIRNKKGQYLCVPIWSIQDSLYWVTPEANEDPTKMPCYQWAIVNVRKNVGGSPFRLVNREFDRISFRYVSVYQNQETGFNLKEMHIDPNFNKDVVIYPNIAKDSIGQNHPDVSAETFVTDMEAKYPASEKISFIPLDQSVKGDQLLGYKYIDDDSTYADVYAFKYLHFMAQGNNAKYISWNGYKTKGDTGLFVNSETIYDKLFFDLQRLTGDELLDTAGNAAVEYIKVSQIDVDNYNKGVYNQNSAFSGIYSSYANKEHNYVNNDSLVLEAFGLKYNDDAISKIGGLRPLARQAYRLFLKDYYKWHPTLKGDYMTVGEQDRYILADRAYASKKYIKGSGRVEGLFGVPHFYFRNTYFDVNASGDDYFAIVQRLDTARADKPDYQYDFGSTTMDDIYEYLVSQFGSVAASKVVGNIRGNHEKSVAVAVVEDATARLKFAVRGDAAIRVSTFQLEQDDDPIYRRFHVNEPADKEFFPELGDRPDTLEFHWLNDGDTGYRLYENSGNYYGTSEPVTGDAFGRFGEEGGRVYNIDKNDKFLRDSLNNVISFLGVNNSAQYGNVSNYAFFVDTAYIKRGTGWIKPQYLIAVDPWKGNEEGACDPATGETNLGINGNYNLARYLFNASQYAKEVSDSVILDNEARNVVYANNAYDKGMLETDKKTAYITDNFNKVEPIQEGVVRRKPTFSWDGSIYTDANTKWERLAFSWAIHKGDSLYVLKGFEPAFGGANNDPDRVWKELTKLYGKEGSTIDFDKLMNSCFVKDDKGKAVTFEEAYYPDGDTKQTGFAKTYHKFKDVPFTMDGKTYNYGLQAIIDLGDNTHKDWVFSMRYVERNASDFVIESETTDRNTQYGPMIRPGYGGWIKYQNGIPTITRSDEKNLMGEAAGSVFNVKQLTNPVSNEVVEGATVVSNVKVIGGAGNVTILNATGKKVVVSNMLGQTVANTVLSSDNASIAVPSGVVVVAVEGETAVKALVK